MLTEKQLKNYWAKVDVKGEDECWNWTAGVSKGGYGYFKIGNEMSGAHRVSAYIEGLIPSIKSISPNDQVLHTCDNRKCQNPNHFFIGSNADNVRDKTEKGRGFITAKLTEQDVIEIRGIYAVGTITQRSLASIYNVKQCLISRIVNKKRWAHI